MKKRDSLWTRIALALWRDRGGYDPATGGMSQDHNVSLLTRARHAARQIAQGVARERSWLFPTIISTVVSVAVCLAAIHYDIAKTQQQMKADAGEILLKCRQDRNGVYACRKIGSR